MTEPSKEGDLRAWLDRLELLSAIGSADTRARPAVRELMRQDAQAALAIRKLMDERDAVFDDVTRSCELASENLQNAYEALEERAEAAEADLARMGAECSGQERKVSKLGRQLADMTSRMQLAENKLAELVRRVRHAYGAGGSAREETLRLWAILAEYEPKP